VADEGQEVSFKNTIDEIANAITVDKDIGLWSATIPEEMQKYWLKDETGSLRHCDEKLLSSHDVAQHRKERNSSMEMHHKVYSSPEPQRRSS